MDNRPDNNRINDLNREKHLFRLRELDDYKVASEDPDVRGWTVVDRNNRSFGTINELIVDPDREKVRYLDIVPTGENPTKDEEHLLIPIGVARIEESDNKVVVSRIERELLNSYPSVKGDAITRDHEYAIIERFNKPEGTTEIRRDNADFYDHEFYDEDRFYTNRSRNRF